MDVTASALRSLIATHKNSGSSAQSRVGSIIRKLRPSPRIDGGNIEPHDLAQFDPQFFNSQFATSKQSCIDIVSKFSASVGRIELDLGNGDFTPIGTCFRVGATDRMRMATAGHMLRWLLGAGNEVRVSHPFEAFQAMLPARVNFHDKGKESETHIYTVEKWVWAHPRWDLLLFDLEPNLTDVEVRTPVTLEKQINRGQSEHPVCVLGYPMSNNSRESETFKATFAFPPETQVELGVKRASPGMCSWPAGELPPAREVEDQSTIHKDLSTIDHDASTLPGSSGSPIFSLVTEKVIGLHYDGGEIHIDSENQTAGSPSTPPPDPNNAVNIPVALLEPQLAEAMSDDSLSAHGQVPIAWHPDPPRWTGAASLAAATQESTQVIPNKNSLQINSVVADRPDFRDHIYRSTLLDPKDVLLPAIDDKRLIRNQQHLPACTAFALAAAINAQLQARETIQKPEQIIEPVSEQMLYAMATLYDEWIDDKKGGSSLRGVIKGFYQNGVCLESTAPLTGDGQHWTLSRKAALQARSITLGAYFKLQPKLLDFQLALNETGAVLVSAHIHRGWTTVKTLRQGSIEQHGTRIGTHAFIIIGYDRTGFIIQNSWGKQWGNWNNAPGLAHWHYNDWAENLIDAWVLRLAPSTPDAFDLVPRVANQNLQFQNESPMTNRLPTLPRPRRFSLIGHVFQIERDRILDRGRLGVGLDSLRETALFLSSKEACEKYPRIAFFFHDPLLGRDTIGKLCAHLIEPFKQQGIYPVHIIYGADESHTIALRVIHECNEINRRFGSVDVEDDLSVYIERRISELMQPLIKVFREGIANAARPGNPLWQVLASIVLEAGEERQYCAYASGIGYSLLEQLPHLAGIETQYLADYDAQHISKEPEKTPACLFEKNLQSCFMLAPSANLAMLEKHKIAEHAMLCTLDNERVLSDTLPGYHGDWIDLTARVTGLDANGTAATRKNKFTQKMQHSTTAKSSTLHDASAEPAVLNKCLALFSQKNINKRNGFVDRTN